MCCPAAAPGPPGATGSCSSKHGLRAGVSTYVCCCRCCCSGGFRSTSISRKHVHRLLSGRSVRRIGAAVWCSQHGTRGSSLLLPAAAGAAAAFAAAGFHAAAAAAYFLMAGLEGPTLPVATSLCLMVLTPPVPTAPSKTAVACTAPAAAPNDVAVAAAVYFGVPQVLEGKCCDPLILLSAAPVPAPACCP